MLTVALLCVHNFTYYWSYHNTYYVFEYY